MLSKPTENTDPIVERLRAFAHESPDLGDAARLYETVLPLLRDADLHVVPIPLDAEEVRVRMESGVPLLSGIDLELDLQAAGELMLQLVQSIESIGINNRTGRSWLPWGRTSDLNGAGAQGKDPFNVSAHKQIRKALENGRLNVGEILAFIAAGDSDVVTTLAQSLGLDPSLLKIMAGYTLKPAFHAWRRQLAVLAEGIQWNKGSCFICGAAATLGELQDNDQVKHLRCGQCGADWMFRRLLCVQCGNEDHGTQRYLYFENRHENARVEVCGCCSGYLKVISTFAPTPPEMLAVEDLATLHLDYIAQERGYSRSTGSRP
jgi:FdhE protein